MMRRVEKGSCDLGLEAGMKQYFVSSSKLYGGTSTSPPYFASNINNALVFLMDHQ